MYRIQILGFGCVQAIMESMFGGALRGDGGERRIARYRMMARGREGALVPGPAAAASASGPVQHR